MEMKLAGKYWETVSARQIIAVFQNTDRFRRIVYLAYALGTFWG